MVWNKKIFITLTILISLFGNLVGASELDKKVAAAKEAKKTMIAAEMAYERAEEELLIESNKTAIQKSESLSTISMSVAEETELTNEKENPTLEEKNAASIAELEKRIPKDEGRLDGDTIKLSSNTHPFSLLGDKFSRDYCAPKNSNLEINIEKDGLVYLNVKSLPSTSLLEKIGLVNRTAKSRYELSKHKTNPDIHIDCSILSELDSVNKDELYSIPRTILDEFGYTKRGWSFGGLVVPFKYYLGGDNRLSTSTTFAPYIGYTVSNWNGMNVTPIVSAGLGLVSVNSSSLSSDGEETTKSETKPTFTTAIGVRFTNPKNKKFSAGLLLGRDFLSRKDSMLDPTTEKTWVSIFMGFDIK